MLSVFFHFPCGTFRLDNILENDPANSTALEQAIKEATDDATFQKVKRMSYSGNAAGEVSFQHTFIRISIHLQLLVVNFSDSKLKIQRITSPL